MSSALVAAPAPPLLPMPAGVEVTGGTCEIGPEVSFSCEAALRLQVDFLAGLLRAATGWAVPVKEGGGAVRFAVDPTLPEEGYKLLVGNDGIRIRASERTGFFYGFQTLRQLMPAAVFQRQGKVSGSWSLPCVALEDQPRFAWRGILVDVSRHFQTKEAMMELIDAMALSKLNTLHWHLTDDQGWRIEIKAYPNLALDSKKFYTQDEIREVVNYAARRGVRIVPEIDVPGHSSAAVRSYPFLGCTLKDGKIARVYNPAKESTYEFTFEYLHGPGTFQIQNAALLADGTVVAEDRHAATATIDPRRPNQYYLLKVEDHRSGAKYELSVALSPAKGGAGGAAMLIPPPAKYSADGAPDKDANRSNQKQPDEL